MAAKGLGCGDQIDAGFDLLQRPGPVIGALIGQGEPTAVLVQAGPEHDREEDGTVLPCPGDLAPADPLRDEASAAAQVVDVEHEGATFDRGATSTSAASDATHISVSLRLIF